MDIVYRQCLLGDIAICGGIDIDIPFAMDWTVLVPLADIQCADDQSVGHRSGSLDNAQTECL